MRRFSMSRRDRGPVQTGSSLLPGDAVPQGSSSRRRLHPGEVLVLSAWCGLAAGWLEVGTRVLCRSIDATNRLYMMSRHFVWLVPLTDLMLFLGMGGILAAATRLRPGVGGWLGPRLICAGAVWPAL